MSEQLLSAEYKECEQKLLAIPRFAVKKNSLDSIRSFLTYLGDNADESICTNLDYRGSRHCGQIPGIFAPLSNIGTKANPLANCKIIHVAGTNGKGSVCAYIDSILRHAGLKTGLFCSPHLLTIRERIRINGEIVSEAVFVFAYRLLCEHMEGYRTENKIDFQPTFFETLFLLSLFIFADEKLDYLILETGIGGRLDATNALLHKDLAVITPIGYDHMEYLGNTHAEIAAEKAGIIRSGVPTVSAVQSAAAATVLTRIAAEIGSELTIMEKDAIEIEEITDKGIDFSLQYRYDKRVSFLLPGGALYQSGNAALAVTAVLRLDDTAVSNEALQKGVNRMEWPARMEELKPRVFFDGAHNADGIEAFIESARVMTGGEKYLLFAVSRWGQCREMVTALKEADIFREIIACPLANPLTNADSCVDSHKELTALFAVEDIFPDISKGMAYLTQKKNEKDYLFIVGSLYSYGEVNEALEVVH
ncbi:MAG: hypothetical protein LBC96_08465 [Lachnospiraceae bacterium]|nr:hypothetical protein [Lachnospiraceae bacterium]